MSRKPELKKLSGVLGDIQENAKVGALVLKEFDGEGWEYLGTLIRAMEHTGNEDSYPEKSDDLLRLRRLGELIKNLSQNL